jgi:hypothetical protein
MAFTPPSSVTVNFDSLVSTTLNNTRAQRYDNIFRKNVFWAFMHSQGRKELYSGGVKIQRALEYAVNGTVASVEGYDTVNLTPQEHLTSLVDEMKEIVGSVVISRREEVLNKAKTQIISLLTSKIENLDRSFAQKMNEMLLAPTGASMVAGNGGKDINPLNVLVSGAANTVHNLNGATSTWWDNQRVASTATTFSTFKKEMRNFYNTCSKHNYGSPDLVLTSQEVAECYEAALEAQVRYQQTDLANLGFETTKLYRASVAWDQICPRWDSTIQLWNGDSTDEHVAYFLNSDYIKLLVEESTDLVNRPFMQSIDQLAKSALVILMCQLVITNRRCQGLMYSIVPSISS